MTTRQPTPGVHENFASDAPKPAHGSSNALLPCPFCGGVGEFSEVNAWWVRCDQCNAETEAFMSPEEATRAWNRRTPPPQSHLRVTQAADAYVAEHGIEHSGGIIERAFEAGALWSVGLAKSGRWRVFEDTTPGYWGIELEEAGNDEDAIMYPQKIRRDTVARIVEAHNAALATQPPQSKPEGTE